MIVLGPGSLYSSIIPNLLVKGIKEAVQNAAGLKLLMCNVMTQAGETDNYSVAQYARTIEGYLGSGVIEYMLINDRICTDDELRPYQKQGMKQMLATDNDRRVLKDMRIMPIESNMISFGQGVARHDADRVAGIMMSLLNES